MHTIFRLRPRSVKWAAKYLGVSEDHVREAIRIGELKYVDLGKGSRTGPPVHGLPYRTTLAFLDEYVMRRSRMLTAAASRPVTLPPSQVIRLMEEVK